MATYRASYWKTTIFFFVVTVVGFVVLAQVRILMTFSATSLAISSVILVLSFVSLLVVVGGLVCLWRDGRNTTGKLEIFAFYANRSHPAGLLRRLGLRFLHGKKLRPGDIVRVNDLSEIEKTLDENRTLEELPFMREMESFCGQVFRVHRRVDKINDMRNKTGLRRVRNAVTLTDVRCSGEMHGACQAECQVIWKDIWLERLVDDHSIDRAPIHQASNSRPVDQLPRSDNQSYFCQMTRLWEASEPMSASDPRQDFRSLFNGNIGVIAFSLAMLTRLFNRVQAWRGGSGYPHMPISPVNKRSPTCELNLRQGDKVIVRSKAEIFKTLVDGRNRGLWYDRDMIRFCGQPARVRKRVSRVIDERSGKMVNMKTPGIVLDDVVGTGEFLRFCPQHEYLFWREIWLQPFSQEGPESGDLPTVNSSVGGD